MLISVIIPAFRAEKFLPRALASIVGQENVNTPIEIIIAADDARDYQFAQSFSDRVKIIPPVGIGTGPGATRNRGINASKGDVLAFLDADDEWSPQYLARLLPHLRRTGGAFAITEVKTHQGETLITLGQGVRRITPQVFGDWPGSFHPLIRREFSPGFTDGAGQDVFHALEVLGRLGGSAPLENKAPYILHLSEASVTANPAFTRRIDQRYKDQQYRYQLGYTDIKGMARLRASQALHRRRKWNKLFGGISFQENGFYSFFAKNRK